MVYCWWIFAWCTISCVALDADPYKVLGIRRTANQAEIKQAYRKKARETHPDKNPDDQEKAEDLFREVAAAYEILSDDTARKKYDRFGHQKQQQQQQQQRGSGGFQGFHQRAQEQHWRFHQEHQRQRRESLLNAKIKKAQDRVLWVNSLSHLRNVAIDDDTGTVDKFFILALYHHGSGCETTLRDRLQFPYPFAQQSDDLGIWWEDVLQTAKALSTAQGRPDGEASDIAGKFGVDVSAEAACPTFLFWKKGARLNRPEKISGFTSNNEFQTWMWEHLKVVAIFRNDHSHEVRVFWMKGQVAESNWVLAPGETQRRIVYLSHLFVARDTRVTARHMKKEACLLWHHVRGGSPDVTEDDDYEIVIESKTKDVHTSCWDWAQQGECTKNPNYMVNECPAACNPKTGALAEGHGVGHGEL